MYVPPDKTRTEIAPTITFNMTTIYLRRCTVIEKNDILYLFLVVIISAILASAWAGMSHSRSRSRFRRTGFQS